MRRLLLLCTLLFAGCSLFVSKPGIVIKGLNFVKLDRDGVEMELMLAVTNPNSFNLRVTGYKYNVVVSDLSLLSEEKHESIEFKGNATTEISLPVKITFHDLLEIVKRIPDPEHVPYRFTAEFDLGTPFGGYTVPVTKNGSFALPRKYRPGQIFKQLNGLFNGSPQ